MFATAALLVLVTLVTGAQLASVGVSSGRDQTALEAAGFPAVPVKSGELATTTVKSVPTHNSSVGSDLLDQEKLDFLLNCQATRERPVGIKDALLCAVYRNLSMVLAARKQDPVTAKTVNDMLKKQQDPSEKGKFCENLSSILVATRKTAEANHEPEQFSATKLEQELVCNGVCFAMNENDFQVNLKPICRVLLWGFRKLLSDVAVDPAVQAAGVVIPPEIGQDVKPEKVEPDANPAPKQPVVATKPVQQSSLPAHVTSSTLSNPAVVGKPLETDAKAEVVDPAVDSKKPVEDKKLTDDDDGTDLFVDQEAKNKQNLEDINGEDVPKDEGDDPTDAEYPANDGDSEEDPSVDTNVPTPAAVGTAPKAVREQQKQSLPKFLGGSKEEITLDDFRHSHELAEDPFFEESDSNFFSYFLFFMFACIVCYVAYHNKSKLLALVLEGRRSSSGRGGFSKGRKHTAAYRKLDSNLEEAITSNTAASSRSQQQIIY